MKVLQIRKSVVKGVLDSCVQGIAQDKIAFASSLFRDKIYSDKLKAALVETVCNAVDEHRKYNIDQCVDIILTKNELCIRDHALGLSDDDVMKIFFQYFESTKSLNNKEIGGFGIGAKAPGSYTDLYYVISYFNGEKTLFASTVNGLESHVSKIYKEPCSPDESGICVRIPLVNEKDYEGFVKLIKDVYIQIGFYSDKEELKPALAPNCADYDEYLTKDEKYKLRAQENFPLDKTAQFKQKRLSGDSGNYVDGEAIVLEHRGYYSGLSGKVFSSSFWSNSNCWAYDGDICYRLDFPAELFTKYNLKTYGRTYILFFKRGELPVSPTRESIEITDFVKSWIENKLKIVIEKVKAQTTKSFWKNLKGNLPLRDVKKSIEESAKYSAFVSGQLFAWPTKYLEDLVDTCKKCSQNDKNNLLPVSLKQRRVWDRLAYSKIYGRIIFIISDGPLKIPYNPFYSAFKKCVASLHGEDYLGNLFASEATRYIGFITSEAQKESFENFKENFTLDGKELLRKNVDYYYASDIIKYSDWKRQAPQKTEDVEAIKDIVTNLRIPESEYSQTIVFAPSDLTKDTNNLKLLLTEYRRWKGSRCCKELGIKHIAKCHKVSCKKFKEKGCIDINDFNIIDRYCKHLKENKITFIPTVIKNYMNALDIDLSSVSEYKQPSDDYREGYTTQGENMLVSQLCGNTFFAHHSNNLNSAFANQLITLPAEELELIYNVCSDVCIDMRFTDSFDAIYDKLKEIKRKKVLENLSIVKDKITNILKTLDFEVKNIKPNK